MQKLSNRTNPATKSATGANTKKVIYILLPSGLIMANMTIAISPIEMPVHRTSETRNNVSWEQLFKVACNSGVFACNAYPSTRELSAVVPTYTCPSWWPLLWFFCNISNREPAANQHFEHGTTTKSYAFGLSRNEPQRGAQYSRRRCILDNQ